MRVSILFYLMIFGFLFSSCEEGFKETPGIFINEILCSNSRVSADPLNHKNVDWIEIYNGYDSIVDLSGFFLSDNEFKLFKWQFPERTKISANSRLIVWADKADTLLHSNFKLSKSAGSVFLHNETQELLDKIEYSTQEVNISFGRTEDGAKQWRYFDVPTPKIQNQNEKGVNSLERANSPEFNTYGGMYNESLRIELSGESKKTEVRYTLDGSTPTRHSDIYKGPISVSDLTVIRAISIEEGKLVSKVSTNSYFVNNEKNGPVVSIVVDPDDFWDEDSGIYSNSLENISRTANFEFFDSNDQVVNQQVDVSISGNVAKHFGQKAMLLEANDNFGNEYLNHQFFPDKHMNQFPSVLLRSGGHPDKYSTSFRDALGLELTKEHTDLDCSSYRPAVVYLNGEYWGYYNLREKANAGFIASNHNLAKDKFDLLQSSWLKVKSGDDYDYKRTLKFINECDKSNSENYERVKQIVDIDNFLNYVIIELYSANVDWPAWNTKFWREKKEGAKWKWVLVDLDYSLGLGTTPDFNMIDHITSPVTTHEKETNTPASTEFFRKMLEFDDFKHDFIQRFAASLNVIYSEERVLEIIEEFTDQKQSEMPSQIERWKDDSYKSPWDETFDFKITPSMEAWYDEIDVVKEFVEKRPAHVISHIQSKFELDELIKINSSSKNGFIYFNSIKLDEGNHLGTYFKNVPVHLKAIPKPGFKFLHWEVNNQRITDAETILIPKGSDTVQAIFLKSRKSLIPSEITSTETLLRSHSPYYSNEDIIINENGRLVVEEGVEILMGTDKSIVVRGGLEMNGSENEPILIHADKESSVALWGGIFIDNSDYDNTISHVRLEDVSRCYNAVKAKASISSFNSKVKLNHVDLNSNFFPFYSEYGEVEIKNSKVFSSKTCDFINIKYATKALVENCELSGNDYPDTDAIDFDGISNGVIRNNEIYGFWGYNSDAIDIGEASSDILIEGNRVFNVTDKGVSIGQGSTAELRNNFFYGCEMGVGIKDAYSYAKIKNCMFYAAGYGVAVFEKNLNSGAGGADVDNCYFYESLTADVLKGELAELNIQNSTFDNDQTFGESNTTVKSSLQKPVGFNFHLAVNKNEISPNMLVSEIKTDKRIVVLSEIYSTVTASNGKVSWIEFYNNSSADIDLSGWTLVNENNQKFTFPQHYILDSNSYLVIASNKEKFSQCFPSVYNMREGLSKKILAAGGSLMLYDAKMNLKDLVELGTFISAEDDEIKLMLKSEKSAANKWLSVAHFKSSPGRANNEILIDQMKLYEPRVKEYLAKITGSEKWLSAVKVKAIKNGKSLEKALRDDALYMVKLENSQEE